MALEEYETTVKEQYVLNIKAESKEEAERIADIISKTLKLNPEFDFEKVYTKEDILT